MENVRDVNTLTEENNATTSPKKRLTPTLSEAAEYFKQYCNATAIHGVRYLVEGGMCLFERLFWVSALALCAVGCALMIAKVKDKLDTTPVIVTFAESATNIWHLPFPAVTICPLTKSRQTIFNFTKYVNMLRDNDNDTFRDDYEAWVEDTFSKMAHNLYLNYHKNVEKHRHDNSTWILERFKLEVIPFLYGDILSERLESLLIHMFGAINSDDHEQFFKPDQLDNATWMQEKWADLKRGSESLSSSIDEYYDEWEMEIRQKVRALFFVCKAANDEFYRLTFPGDGWPENVDNGTLKFLKKVAASMDLRTRRPGRFENNVAIWDHLPYMLSEVFHLIWTDEGLCFTFNMMDNDQIYRDHVITNKELWHQSVLSRWALISDSWNPDTGYSTKAGRETYPIRSRGVGKDAGLYIEKAELYADIDYLCSEWGASGYKVILHRPEDQPQSQVHFVAEVPLSKDVSIVLKPALMTTSAGLRELAPAKRQCYYSHEKRLEYFKFYSQNNCELECLTKATLERCGCVEFYMPSAVEERELDEDLKKVSEREEGSFGSTIAESHCDCLPSCVSISYQADVTMVDPDEKRFWAAGNAAREETLSVTLIRIFFKEKYFLASRRSELYGKIDFLANCGGLLGLFSGFSLISLVEIIYFLTFRLWAILLRRFHAKQLRSANEAPIMREDTAQTILENSIEESQQASDATLPHV